MGWVDPTNWAELSPRKIGPISTKKGFISFFLFWVGPDPKFIA
jgi:hypothetical protein